MSDLKVGAIVWLKGGSPKMTVREVRSDDEWRCDWFDGNKLVTGFFKNDQLTTKNPDELPTDISLQ